ncbi:MAG TPA: GMC family oxidoreductase N-terminal domain-containing protein [Thermoleophilaceae bacterium]|jgi:long-chain-alcohol oxidase|nr:GMC family oxidoreductase N-terminal domain-containing protein [Thermoleophilaceae bacterium]
MSATTPLNPRARRALESICDTFAPGGAGLPSATELGVPDALLELVSRNPRASERKQVGQLLGLWDTRLLTAVGGGGLRHFSGLSQGQREKVLLSWADSRAAQRRAAFQALRKGTLLAYYGMDGGNPVLEAMGYPGPLGPPADPPAPGIEPLTIDSDTDLSCDVVVVGSGAGGGTAAAVLAAAGLDVIVIEAGGYYSEKDFDGAELSGFKRLYQNAGGVASHDGSIGLLAGSCLGGGTVVNYTFSFRTPEVVRREWADMGLPAVAGQAFDDSLDAVWERISVNEEHSVPSARDESIRRGLDRLGWDSQVMKRNVRGCTAEVCRLCHYGCQLGAKQSTLKTWLQDAHDAGTRTLVNTRADRVIVADGAARGVEARTSEGHRVTVRARAVVSAAGALQTPALLLRSGLESKALGKNLRLHPVMVVWGQMEEEVRPWEGMLSATFSDQHSDIHDGYGVKYEHVATPPSILLSFSPWRGGRAHQELMQALPYTAGVGVLLRDHGVGEVRVGRDGEPIVRYAFTDRDVQHLRTGIAGGAELVEAMGAKLIYSSHAGWVAYQPGRSGDRVSFMRDADACGWGPGQTQPVSFHIMGSARMGGSEADSVCDPNGQTWAVRDLYVCDGSAFPTATGVNPMVTIEALAHMNARGLAERLA